MMSRDTSSAVCGMSVRRNLFAKVFFSVFQQGHGGVQVGVHCAQWVLIFYGAKYK